MLLFLIPNLRNYAKRIQFTWRTNMHEALIGKIKIGIRKHFEYKI